MYTWYERVVGRRKKRANLFQLFVYAVHCDHTRCSMFIWFGVLGESGPGVETQFYKFFRRIYPLVQARSYEEKMYRIVHMIDLIHDASIFFLFVHMHSTAVAEVRGYIQKTKAARFFKNQMKIRSTPST